MIKHIVVTAAAIAGATLLVAPPASAGDGAMIEAELSPWDNVQQVSPTRWYVGQSEDFTFTVDVTNDSVHGQDALTVFVSVPFEVTGYEGDRWNCWDVDGGVQCANPDVTVPREDWPTLFVHGRTTEVDIRDSIDVYATSNVGADHSGMEFYSY